MLARSCLLIAFLASVTFAVAAPPFAPAPGQPAAPAGPMIDNPQYKAWASYKPGTSYRNQQVRDQDDTHAEWSFTMKLVEVTPDAVILDMSAIINQGGQKFEPPPQKITIPAKVPAPPATQPAAAPATQPAAEEKTGEEEITTPAGKFKCQWKEVTVKVNGVTRTSKVWTCDQVPEGGVVRCIRTSDAGSGEKYYKYELIELKIEK